ncbi:MAG TPA: hypothetical protein VF084_13545 [Nitrososphaeraceae archaeon]|jgi:hypothetical protein
MKTFTNISLAAVTIVVVTSIVTSLSLFAVTSPNNIAFAQKNDGFDKELKLLNQTLTTLGNQDKSAKKSLFDAEGIIEDKMKDNPEIVNAEKRVEAAIKMVGEGNFQAAIDHTNEAIKTLNNFNN